MIRKHDLLIQFSNIGCSRSHQSLESCRERETISRKVQFPRTSLGWCTSFPKLPSWLHNPILTLISQQCSIDAHGEPLTAEALEAAKNADAVLLGAIGGPKWGTGKVRPEQGILALRKQMGTYGNLRPCNFASPTLTEISPLKEKVCEGVDFCIVRELTGGIYFGERKEDEGDGKAWDTEPYSREEIARVTRLAANLALAQDPPAPVWSLDKANVLATSRLWRKTVTEVMAAEFPQLSIGHHLIDSAAMLMVKDPRKLNGIVVTSNLFGDIISDEASVIPGSIGLLPSASLSGVPDGKSRCNGIYEPIHGMLLPLPPFQLIQFHI